MLQMAKAALRFAVDVLQWPIGDIIVMGCSLGAAVATQLACSSKCHGLVLVAPFVSLADAAWRFVGFLAPLVAGDLFDTRAHMAQVKIPTLIIHGQSDNVIPCDQGKLLYDVCPCEKKLFVSPKDMHHNIDLLSHTDYLLRPVLRFFALPDYAFYEPIVPESAFDRRLCPQYHDGKIPDDPGAAQPLREWIQSSSQSGPMDSRELQTNKGPRNTYDVVAKPAGDVDDRVECSDAQSDLDEEVLLMSEVDSSGDGKRQAASSTRWEK